MRDSQRSKVYRAEQEAFRTMPHRDDRNVVACVREIERSDYWYTVLDRLDRLPGRKITRPIQVYFSPTANRATAWGQSWRIRFCSRKTPLWLILHEMAHLASRTSPISHGSDFCRRYLELVQEFISDDAADTLRRYFLLYKVRFVGTDREHVEKLRERERRALGRKHRKIAERLKQHLTNRAAGGIYTS